MNQDGKLNGTAVIMHRRILTSLHTNTDVCLTEKWMDNHKWYNDSTGADDTLPMSILSTCTGCGIRVATANLVGGGRSNAVWVMVVLSDGVANLTDTPQTFPEARRGRHPCRVIRMVIVAAVWVMIHLWSPKFLCENRFHTLLYQSHAVWLPLPRWRRVKIARHGAVFESAPVRFRLLTARKIMPAIWWIGLPLLIRQANSKETLGSDMAIYTIGLGDSRCWQGRL